MRGLVLGLGSMGKRRIRLLRGLDPLMEIVGVDSDHGRREEARSVFGIRTAVSLADAFNQGPFDCGFVCTPPLTHAAIVIELLGQGLHVFSELNLVSDGYEEILSTARTAGRVAFLSSTQLYRRELRYVGERVAEEQNPFAYRYHVGQYLPDWHPWESYTDFFVRDRRTNGIREILAIELPWILKAFGPVKDVQVVKTKLTRLDLDYEDLFMIQLEHEQGHVGSLQADLVSRIPTRQLTVLSETSHITWQGQPDTLYDSRDGKVGAVVLYDENLSDASYAPFILENAYYEELQAFLSAIKGNAEDVRYSYQSDLAVLALIDRIEAQ